LTAPRARRTSKTGSEVFVVATWLRLTVVLAVVITSTRAWGFDPIGHDIIEAAAYRRLLETAAVPGTGVSGPTLLATLMAQEVLSAPPCFGDPQDRHCSAEALRRAPLYAWPPLGSGAADLLIDRQLDAHGQCQHFMAETADGRSPIDPRLGVPGALATTAYDRCMRILGAVLDNVLRHPRLAAWRVAGIYVLMHAIEDSFSPAHARRDEAGRIVHLMSWKLIDLPVYLWHGQLSFPAETHHGLTDPRDGTFLIEGGRAADGRPCTSFHQPYAVPEECLGERARGAVAAVVDLLVLTYTLRHQAAVEGTVASLESPAGLAAWAAFVRTHLPSASTELVVEPERIEAPPRPDVFLGVLGSWRPGGWGAGLWGGRLFYGPALPFAVGLFGSAGAAHEAERDGRLIGNLALSLYLPLVRRFVIGFSPAALQVVCTTELRHCTTEGQATVGSLIVRLGPAWLALQGPTWSWNEREFRDTRLAVALGWWHERHPREAPPGEPPPTWNPPAPADVQAYRLRRTTTLAYLTATAASTAQNQTVGAGLETLLDRDRWGRRAGLAPGVSLEYSAGTVEGRRTGLLAFGTVGRWYLAPDRLALAVAPAVVRVRTGGPDARGPVDVSGRIGLAFKVGTTEVRADAPPLSYVSTERWHSRPFSVSLALVLR
jgi:hypothetical protein